MLQIANKPLVEEIASNQFSFFSSKQESSTDSRRLETPGTTFNPLFTQVICPLREDSPNLDMMVNQPLFTPKKPTRRYTDIWLHCTMEEEYKNLELKGERQSISISNTIMSQSCPEINEKACKSESFLIPKYLLVNGSHWNETSVMVYDKSPSQTDSGFASPERSSLSISSSRSFSISPCTELSEKVRKSVEGAKLTQTCEKEVPVKFDSVRAMCSQKSNIPNKVQDNWEEVVNTKNKGKHLRSNRFRRQSKQTNLRTSIDKSKSGYHKDQNQLVSSFRGKARNKDFQVYGSISPTSSSGYNSKRSRKRVYKHGQARETPERALTLGDALTMLMNKPNMFLAFVTDQEGSRFLQEHLVSATDGQLQSTFNHLQRHFVTICQNVFGNYIAQKYLEFGSDKLRHSIFETLQTSIPVLSMGMYGSRVVQKLLQCGTHEQKLLVAKQLKGSIIKFVYNQYGNHVVQKIIQCLNPDEIGFVVDEISGYTYNLAMHPSGSRVIQRLLENLNRCVARPLLDEIKKNAIALSKNQFGNYIVQYIIKHCVKERTEIIVKLIGRVAELSGEKKASNVIELAKEKSAVRNESPLSERYSALALLDNDPFGKYVLQTLLEWSSGAIRQRLLKCLRTCRKKKDYVKNFPLKVGQVSRTDSSNIK